MGMIGAEATSGTGGMGMMGAKAKSGTGGIGMMGAEATSGTGGIGMIGAADAVATKRIARMNVKPIRPNLHVRMECDSLVGPFVTLLHSQSTPTGSFSLQQK